MGTSYLKMPSPELLIKKKKQFQLRLSYNSMQKKNAQKSNFLKQKLCTKTKAMFRICCLSKKQLGGPQKKRRKRTLWAKVFFGLCNSVVTKNIYTKKGTKSEAQRENTDTKTVVIFSELVKSKPHIPQEDSMVLEISGSYSNIQELFCRKKDLGFSPPTIFIFGNIPNAEKNYFNLKM